MTMLPVIGAYVIGERCLFAGKPVPQRAAAHVRVLVIGASGATAYVSAE